MPSSHPDDTFLRNLSLVLRGLGLFCTAWNLLASYWDMLPMLHSSLWGGLPQGSSYSANINLSLILFAVGYSLQVRNKLGWIFTQIMLGLVSLFFIILIASMYNTLYVVISMEESAEVMIAWLRRGILADGLLLITIFFFLIYFHLPIVKNLYKQHE